MPGRFVARAGEIVELEPVALATGLSRRAPDAPARRSGTRRAPPGSRPTSCSPSPSPSGMAMGGKAQSRRWPQLRDGGRAPLRRPARRLADRRPRRSRSRSTRSCRSRCAQLARPVHVDATGRSGPGSASPPPSCCSRSRSRTTTGTGCRTASGGARTTSTSPSGPPPRCTACSRGTDRSATWLAVLYGVSIGSVRRDPPLALRRLLAPLARRRRRRAAGVVALPLLMLGPAAQEPAALELGSLRRAAHGTGDPQRHPPEADRLLRRRRRRRRRSCSCAPTCSSRRSSLDATSLQLEYLPSGDVCRGRVTSIGGTSFAGRCVLPSGAARWVDASWDPCGRRLRGRGDDPAACVGPSPLAALALVAACSCGVGARGAAAHPGPASRLPGAEPGLVPGYVMIADRNNNRIIIVNPRTNTVVWQFPRPGDVLPGQSFHDPDDAFFTPGYKSISTNEEYNQQIGEIDIKTHRIVWTFGHAGVARLRLRLPRQPGRRVPAAERALHGRGHPELPRALHQPRAQGRARDRPRRQLRPQPAAGALVAERRDAARRTAACS